MSNLEPIKAAETGEEQQQMKVILALLKARNLTLEDLEIAIRNDIITKEKVEKSTSVMMVNDLKATVEDTLRRLGKV